jgi:para-nitrobenzyl esterase
MQKILTLIFLVAYHLAVYTQGSGPVLSIDGGQIQGLSTATSGVFVYKGIPYAAPPTGDLRWKEPQPVIPWLGVRIMDKFGMQSMQRDRVPGQFYQKEFYWMGDGVRSEDCLFLNVWTPSPGDPDKKLPVAMWIHGGAYMSGSGGEIQMDGEAWAERGVVLVTINYRLGLFGFLAHPLLSEESPNRVSGNYGIFDQIAALKWIVQNIEQFGGDPGNITVFGQSAGAGSVQTLVASPLTKGMIKKAIIQSGGGIRGLGDVGLNTSDMAATGMIWKEIMDKAGITTAAMMRSLTFGEMTETTGMNDVNPAVRQPVRPAPLIDGYLSVKTFSDAVKSGDVADIPYMIGYTANDIGNMREGIEQFCMIRSETSKQPVYAYLFSRKLPGDDSGAFHSSELWYMFRTLGKSWRPFTEADFRLSDEMVDCWTNFVRNGDPNGQSGAGWKSFTKSEPYFKIFNVK